MQFDDSGEVMQKYRELGEFTAWAVTVTVCTSCHAGIGTMCTGHNSNGGTSLHRQRRRDAQKLWRNQKAYGRRA